MVNSDNGSFEEMIEVNKKAIFRICSIYASPPFEAEDLFQEVIFQAWKSYDSFLGKSKVSTWIYRVALNVCIQHQLKSDRKTLPTVDLESVRFIKHEDQESEEKQERYQVLKTCISSLNESDRSIIVLYLEDLPYKKIASITGLSENHVAVKMKRIKEKLHSCIIKKPE